MNSNYYIVIIKRTNYFGRFIVAATTANEAAEKVEERVGINPNKYDQTLSIRCLQDAKLIL